LLSNRAAAHLKAGAAQAAAVDAATALLQCPVQKLSQEVAQQLRWFEQKSEKKSDQGSSSDQEDLPPLEHVRDLT
jgi:hypothetical protein